MWAKLILMLTDICYLLPRSPLQAVEFAPILFDTLL